MKDLVEERLVAFMESYGEDEEYKMPEKKEIEKIKKELIDDGKILDILDEYNSDAYMDLMDALSNYFGNTLKKENK